MTTHNYHTEVGDRVVVTDDYRYLSRIEGRVGTVILYDGYMQYKVRLDDRRLPRWFWYSEIHPFGVHHKE